MSLQLIVRPWLYFKVSDLFITYKDDPNRHEGGRDDHLAVVLKSTYLEEDQESN